MLPDSVYRDRRARLMEALGPRAVAVFPAAPEKVRSGGSDYPYRPSSDLLYLTGFAEPESALVLRPGAEKDQVLLFVRPRDRHREQWTGRRAGPEGAILEYGVDAARTIGELDGLLATLLANRDDLHYTLGVDEAFDAKIAGTLHYLRGAERRVGRGPQRVVDPAGTVHEMRLRKGPEEIGLLEAAARITAEAFVAAMGAARPGAREYEVQAAIEHVFRRRGAAGPAYETIVASGKNATVLHYAANSGTIEDGALVLVDAGAELDFYASDVSRTVPAGGRFSPAQRRCYDLVLAAHEEALGMVRPGITLDDVHGSVVARLTEGMIGLGLLAGAAQGRIEDESYKRYYMHQTSHWLGLDAHDAGRYVGPGGAARALEPGMVFSVEPGLYVPADDLTAPQELRGIGIRVEDDVLVTEAGHRNLTEAIPRRPEDVEAACHAARATSA